MSDQAAYDVESILLRLKELVEAGRSMPMSASVLVNREEFLELLEESIATLPQELRHSRWLLKEREEFLSQARREADDIIEAGRVRADPVRLGSRNQEGRIEMMVEIDCPGGGCGSPRWDRRDQRGGSAASGQRGNDLAPRNPGAILRSFHHLPSVLLALPARLAWKSYFGFSPAAASLAASARRRYEQRR